MITQKVYATDIKGRLDPFFYDAKVLGVKNRLTKKYGQHKLGEVIDDIYRYPTFYGFSFDKQGVPVIKGENVSDEGIINKEQDFDCVSIEIHEKYPRTALEKDDLVFTVRGVIGKTGFYDGFAENANISPNVIKIRIKKNHNARFYWVFLNSSIGQQLIQNLASGQVQKTITVPDIKNIQVPLVSETTQNKIVTIIQNAYKNREEKLKQADELLNSIDDYVRQQLGIDYAEPEEEKIYTVKSQDLEDNRQDPYYYNPKFVNLLNTVSSKLKMVSLSDISEGVFNGNTPAKDKYTNEGKPIVKVSCLKKNKIEWSNLSYAKDKKLNKHLKDNDILLLSSAHQAEYLGKNPCLVEIPDDLRERDITFVGELICIRPNTKLVNPYYLLAILRLDEYHQLINREKRGQTSHIYPNDLEKIAIPLADKGKQDTIAQEFTNRLNKAEDLKNEASKLLEEAKKKVEAMILN